MTTFYRRVHRRIIAARLQVLVVRGGALNGLILSISRPDFLIAAYVTVATKHPLWLVRVIVVG